jgi:hypothetical protein
MEAALLSGTQALLDVGKKYGTEKIMLTVEQG